MSREIKFRVWDKRNSKMWRVLSIDFHFGTVMCTDSFIEGEQRPCVKIKLSECELMEFTGLHDKFGFGIYEGDHLANGEFIPWTVQFNDGGFSFYNQIDPNRSWSPLCHGDAITREIVGNIYERGVIE